MGALEVLAGKAINKQWLLDKKVVPHHPQMKSYSEINLRHRFLKGFSLKALDLLYTKVWVRMGAMGISSKHLPVGRNILLDPSILTSAGAFCFIHFSLIWGLWDLWCQAPLRYLMYSREPTILAPYGGQCSELGPRVVPEEFHLRFRTDMDVQI